MDEARELNQNEIAAPADLSNKIPRDFALPHLEFQEQEEVSAIPTPDQIPVAAKDSSIQIPLEIQESATFEALISQNDDLIARLKVTLRRLALTENENRRLKQVLQTLENKNLHLGDNEKIWQEKEDRWRKKEKQLENILRDFQTKLPEYENLHEKLDRYKKYHERIKTQVKPFVHQLKTYADSLMAEIQKLNAEIAAKDASLQQHKADRASLQSDFERQQRQVEQRMELLVQHYENRLDMARQECNEMQANLLKLEQKCQTFDEVRSREDELTNVIIALRRAKEEQFQNQTERENDLRNELGRTKAQLIQAQESQQNLTAKNLGLESLQQKTHSQMHQLEEQLASLRFMWTAKSNELEQSRAQNLALEKLNSELSRQLQDLRRQTENQG